MNKIIQSSLVTLVCVAIVNGGEISFHCLRSFSYFSYAPSFNSVAKLHVENDGPTVAGFPIEFTAIYYGIGDFIFVFEDKYNKTKTKEVYQRAGVPAKVKFVYDTPPEGNDHEIIVSVYFQVFGARAWFETSQSNRFIISSKYLSAHVLHLRTNNIYNIYV